MSIGNNSIGETVTASALVGSTKATTVVLINAEHVLSESGKNIRLPTTEFFLRTAAGDLSMSKNLCFRVALNDVLLQLFPIEAAILEGEIEAAELLKTFTKKISERGLGYAANYSEIEGKSGSDEEEDNKDTKYKAVLKGVTECDTTY